MTDCDIGVLYKMLMCVLHFDLSLPTFPLSVIQALYDCGWLYEPIAFMMLYELNNELYMYIYSDTDGYAIMVDYKNFV